MWATHYGGTWELYKKCMFKMECIDQMTTLCSWAQPNGNNGTNRHQDPRRYYTKEYESFIVGNLARQLYGQVHDSIHYPTEGYKFGPLS